MISQEQLKMIIAKVVQNQALEKIEKIDASEGTLEATIHNVHMAFEQWKSLTLAKQSQILDALKVHLLANSESVLTASIQLHQGKRDDKKRLLEHLIAQTPTIESIKPEAITGDHGLTLCDYSAYGVFLVQLPKYQAIETLINQFLGILSSGSGILFLGNASQKEALVSVINCLKFKLKEYSLENLVDCICLENGMLGELLSHPKVKAFTATDCDALAHVCLNMDKKFFISKTTAVPVIVDQTADLKTAAANIIKGTNFDHNLLFGAEKVVIVVDDAFDYFSHCLEVQGGAWINELAPKLLASDFEGSQIAGLAIDKVLAHFSLPCKQGTKVGLMVIEPNDLNASFNKTKGLPVLFVVRAKSIEEAICFAKLIDNDRHFMAIMHSKNIDHLSLCARAMQTALFIKNAPSYASLGIEGEGFPSMMIANITGEGVLEPKTYSRKRRCVLAEGFLIR